MPGKIERSIRELYADDPARADAVVLGREANVNRRGFLGGAGLAAMGAAVGGTIPFAENMPNGLIPAAFAQSQPTSPPPSAPTAPAAPAAPAAPKETAFPPRARSPGGWQNPFLNR